MTTRVLVTGASGFIGSAVAARLRRSNAFAVRTAARKPMDNHAEDTGAVRIADIGPDTDWNSALSCVDAVVHAAARVHVMKDTVAEPAAEYHRVNVLGTLNLARQAAVAGVRRFVFLSSIKVNGEETKLNVPFKADDIPAPAGAYAVSKREAEDGLRRIASETGIEVVVVRPPLVYGPGVQANFLTVMQWLCRGIPMPLGAVHNKRSLIALDNLVDLLATCINHPAAASQVFLASDGEDLSTTELLLRAGQALGKPARLVPLPAYILRTAAFAFARGETYRRVCGSLQVDISKNRELLGWVPKVRVDDALRATARHFLNESARR